jgi:hypothetical protein
VFQVNRSPIDVNPTKPASCAGHVGYHRQCSLVGYADAAAGGTKHSWQSLTAASYNFTKSIVAKVGYRVISVDYEKTSFLYNVMTSGLFAGVGIRF